MPTEPVQIALISSVSGVAIAYIVNVLAKKVQANKVQKQPKDRTEQMFDGYERLIKQKDGEIERQRRELDEERNRGSARESQLLGELEVERIAKKQLLEQVQHLQSQVIIFQQQIATLEQQVKKALGE